MRINLAIIITLLSTLLLIVFLNIDKSKSSNSGDEFFKRLQDYYTPIESISPEDTTFKDLFFLKNTLKDVDVILLGEQQHGDGSTFQAKSRLIKFLHQELGFNVLLYEASLYQCFELDQLIKQKDTLNTNLFNNGLWFFWSRPNEVKSLLTYLNREIVERRFSIGGFDIQHSGQIDLKTRKKNLISILTKRYSADTNQYRNFSSSFDQYHFKWKYTSNKKDEILKEISNLIKLTSNNLRTREDTIFNRHLINIYCDYYQKMKMTSSLLQRVNYRDSMMAENFFWLKNNLYKNNKIIIWAANSHVIFNRDKLSRFDSVVPMGHYLKEKYGNKCYTLSFTSGYGETFNRYKGKRDILNDSALSGFEMYINKKVMNYGFINFNNIQDTILKNKSFYMKCLGHSNIEGKWLQMTDGVFYIDKMNPITFN